jgi:hypothetical protein
MYIFEFQTAKYAAHLRSRPERVKQSILVAGFSRAARRRGRVFLLEL